MSTSAAPTLKLSDAKERRKLSSEKLHVPLTDRDLLERGQEVTDLSNERARLEDAKKAAAADFKLRIAEVDTRFAELMDSIRTGRERRDVEVEVVWHYDLGEVVTTRTDTGAFVRTRPMTSKERQTQMDMDDEPGDES